MLQQLCRGLLSFCGRHFQSSKTHVVHNGNVGSLAQKDPDNALVTLDGGDHDSSSSCVSPFGRAFIDVNGSAREQG